MSEGPKKPRAHKFINVGGKTFYFNINTTGNGYRYLTIVARKGQDAKSDEKVTLFPNQIGSFLHCFMDTYSEMCRQEGIANYLAAPFMVKEGGMADIPERPSNSGSPETKSDESDREPQCPDCGVPPLHLYPDAMVGLLISLSPETKGWVRVRCGQCGWHPKSEKVTDFGDAIFRVDTPEGEWWEEWADG